MTTFSSYDGTVLAYHVRGEGPPLICLPGGPMRATSYLGDLGGLPARTLTLLDLRGTGQSAVPSDPASYRCDRQVDDIEALRQHLGLDQVDLLGHSAGGALAVLYAVRYPQRVARLLLITPSPRVVGLAPGPGTRRAIIEQRRDDPFYEQVSAALDRITAGSEDDADWEALAPFLYGRWDKAAQEHLAAEEDQVNYDAGEVFYAAGAFDPEANRAALASFASPVLLLGGGFDHVCDQATAASFAALMPNARLVIQPGAGHYPWLDDASAFSTAVTGFLTATS